MIPLDAAVELLRTGRSVIPIKADGSKAPAIPWKEYQSVRMSEAEARRHFANGGGIGLIAGEVSGNLEIIDIESAAPFAELAGLIRKQAPDLLATIPQVQTPTGGRHLFYCCSEIQGNQKLAADATGKVLIETRGEGGYVVTVTSPPECHPSGKTYQRIQGSIREIPTITKKQRDILLSCCRSFNRHIKETHAAQPAKTNGHLRPGDDYNARGEPLAVLQAHGWSVLWQQGETLYLRRPGKEFGVSATLHRVAHNVLYVFSTNAAPFESGRAYDTFGVYTRLEHNGDLKAATKAIAAQGYGEAEHSANTAPSIVNRDVLPVPYEMMALTQYNAAQAFEQIYSERFRYCKAWGQWLEWLDSRWASEHTDLAFHFVVKLVAKLNRTMKPEAGKASFAIGAERIARASRAFATKANDWDRDNWALNMPAGTYELQTGRIRPHVKSDHITKITQVTAEEGPHPVFDRFMRDITLEDEPLIEYHQRALGACLSGAIQDNFLLFWYGTGQNGKNTLGDLVTWILGDYAKMIPIETLIATKSGSHPTTLANLRGLRLAVCSEVSEGSYWDEARVKSLTGDTEISARFMRQDFFEFARTHKHLVYGNHRPMLRIVDPGIKSRLHLSPFKAYFPPEARDPLIRQKLEVEAPAILWWLIEGHSKWLEDGYLKKCSAVQAETDAYFESQSTPDMWIAECCVIDDLAKGPAKDLFASFKAWKEARGEGVMSQTRWGEWMSQRFSKIHLSGFVHYRGLDIKPTSIFASISKP